MKSEIKEQIKQRFIDWFTNQKDNGIKLVAKRCRYDASDKTYECTAVHTMPKEAMVYYEGSDPTGLPDDFETSIYKPLAQDLYKNIASIGNFIDMSGDMADESVWEGSEYAKYLSKVNEPLFVTTLWVSDLRDEDRDWYEFHDNSHLYTY